MVWYSHLLKNFPEFIVIHIVNGTGIVNKAEIDVFFFFFFLKLSSFFNDPVDVGNLISGSSAFSKTSLNEHLEVHNGPFNLPKIMLLKLFYIYRISGQISN